LSNYQGYDTPYPSELHTGDKNDDDAQIIDDYFETTSLPPDPKAATTSFEDHSRYAPPKIQRLFGGFQVISTAVLAPIQVAWPDANRKYIVLDFFSSVPADFIRYSGNQNDIMTPTGALSGLGVRLYDGKGPVVISYNGPLWVGDLTITGSGVVSWTIITE